LPENVQRDILYINLACLSVRLYPINVKTAEPIGPKFCVGPNVTPGEVYELPKLEKFVFKSFYFFLFFKILKSADFAIKSAKFFFPLFFNVYNENTFTIEIEDGREVP